jgi:PAS domain S-box-containing protein
MTATFFRTILIAFLLTLLPGAAIAENSTVQPTQKKHVLVLNSYHKGLTWTDNIVAGIESVLKSESESKGIELYYEYMDTKRYYGERYMQKLYGILAEKYRNERFDAVIVADNDAFDFVRRHYNKKMFRSVPVVFCGVNNFKDSMLAGFKRFTGVVEDTDVRRTIEVALKLHPRAAEILVVGDKTTTGNAMKQEVLEVMSDFTEKVKFVFLSEDFDFGELLTKLQTIPPETIVLLTVVNRDRKGNFFAYEESLKLIREATNSPIYSFWDFYLGGGIVGGRLTSGVQQGKAAAEMALRIVKGEDISAIPVIRNSPNLYMFDYREMSRFGITLSKLPPESVVINQPDTFYARYKNIILAGSVVIFILSLTIIVLLVNLSLRNRYENALKVSEEKYRDLYDHAPDMYHSIDKDGIVADCNETEARMLGYRKEEIIGRPITDFLTPDSRKTYEREFATLKDHKALFGLDREFVRKDGTTFPATLNVFIELDKQGNLVRTKTIARDMSEPKRVERELRQSREDLRSLSAHIQSAREEERGSIAREIHDELGQILSKLKLDIAWLKKRMSGDQAPLIEKAGKMSELVDSTIRTVQKISSELRPGVLDYLGLSAAIEWQAKEFQERTGITCSIAIAPEIAIEDKNISTAVFRIFQETLTNIMRHANAGRVSVALKQEDHLLVLEVRDNGQGIVHDRIANHGSFGLMGMQERARFLGGRVVITGTPEQGTTVLVQIPLDGKVQL